MPTHYDLLGVRTDATADEIRHAYRSMARRIHPDALATGSAAGGASSQDMAALNEAWRVLSDPGRRALYDASLRTKSSAPPRPATPAPARQPEPADRGGRFPKWPFVMIFVFAVPVFGGIANYVLPIMIGAWPESKSVIAAPVLL